MPETKYNTLGALLGIQIESHVHVLVAMQKAWLIFGLQSFSKALCCKFTWQIQRVI